MDKPKKKRAEPGHLFPTAEEDLRRTRDVAERGYTHEQLESSAYRLAFGDQDFLLSEDLRGVRLMLELNKPETVLNKEKIEHTVVIYGSARIISAAAVEQAMRELEEERRINPDDPGLPARAARLEFQKQQSRYYEEARRFAALVTMRSLCEACPQLHIITGGGPGIMEAANLGAFEAGGESIGLNIVLPHEQFPNPFVTPKVCFQFHYFGIRKMHFLLRARALVVFPGGFGTLDELFETLTLVQTRKIEPMPILIFGREFWDGIINFELMVEKGVISREDLDLFCYVETAEEAWELIKQSLED
jgi:uncharacterized protein (TIGR00730 family)